MAESPLTLSFVVPVFQGEPWLEKLVGRIDELRAHLEKNEPRLRHIETIFVCDDPKDGSGELLRKLGASRPWLTVVHLSKNMGQHAASAAGMLHTSGEWVVTLDEDGQHDPMQVPALLDHCIRQHGDICYANPSGAVHPQAWRNISSRLAKRIIVLIAGDPYVPLFNSFRLVRGEIARAAAALASHDLYLDLALRWFTDRVQSLKLEMADPRGQGDSGYGLGRLIGHFARLAKSYHQRLLSLVMWLGFLTAFTFGTVGLANVGLRVFYPDAIPVRGWTSLVLLISFFGGTSAFLLGFVLERLSVTMTRAQGRPAFFLVDRTRDAVWLEQRPQLVPQQSASS